MKCPNCGYTSFDHLDKCKVCGEDLVPAKIKLNIYTRPPEIEIGQDGFNVGKIGASEANMLADARENTIFTETLLGKDGVDPTSFDFSENKNS